METDRRQCEQGWVRWLDNEVRVYGDDYTVEIKKIIKDTNASVANIDMVYCRMVFF